MCFYLNASDLLPYHHPLNFGRPGVVAQRHSNFIVQLADVIISIGSSLDNVLTAYAPRKFGKKAKVVVVDIDPNQLEEAKIKAFKKINAAAGQFILSLTDLLFSAAFTPDVDDWIEDCEKLKSRFENDLPSDPSNFDRISHKDFVLGISDILPENQLICTGSSGLAIEAFYMMFRNKIGQKYFLTSGLGSMGYGLPASIGVAVENPGRTVVLVESDGSLAMNIQEMQTVTNLNLPICVLLMNNSGYASIRNTMRNYFDSRYFGTGTEAGHAMPDFEKLAGSYGFRYKLATSVEHIRQAFENFKSSCRPMLVDVQLQINETLAPKCIALPQDDGSIVSMPMEDMSPLLTLHELRSVMGDSLSDASIKARDQQG